MPFETSFTLYATVLYTVQYVHILYHLMDFSMDDNQNSTTSVQDTKENKFISTLNGEFLNSLFKISLFLGAVISWLYFSFYVGALPAFSSLGDATGYLLFIVLWAALISLTILMLAFFPVMTIRDVYITNGDDDLTLKKKKIFVAAFFITIPLLVTALIYLYPTLMKHISWVTFSILIVSALIGAWKTKSFSVVNALIIYSLAAMLATLIIISTQQYLLWILLFFIILMNIILVGEKQIKLSIIGLFSIMLLSIFSIIISMIKIDNPIIVKPFELLQLGHYNAELHFKNEFLSKENPLHLNDINSSFAKFFILSSVGDEYIAREIRSDSNKSVVGSTLYPFLLDNKQYFYSDKNNSDIYILENNQIIKLDTKNTHVLSMSKKQYEHDKSIDGKVLRIKKENIAYEVTDR